MSPFGRRQQRERTPEDRERARLEREARRAAREGRPLPAAPPPGDEPDAGLGDLAWDDAATAQAQQSWDYGDPVTFDGPGANGHADDPAAAANGHAADPAGAGLAEGTAHAGDSATVDAGHAGDSATVDAGHAGDAATVDAGHAGDSATVDAGHAGDSATVDDAARRPHPASRASWDDTDAWDAHPPVAEPPAEETPAPPPPAAADAGRTPSWDDTDAWEAHPPAAEPPASSAPDPAPTLGEEIAAVDRGWFEDEPATRTTEEPGERTVEWDVLENRPKQATEPPSGPAGADTPTVEWDVLAEAPKEPVREPREDLPAAPSGDAAPAAAPSSSPAGRSARFGDEHERPVPIRRVNRTRTLPPTPPAPGDKRRGGRRFGRGTLLGIVGIFVVLAVLYLLNALFQPLHDDGTGSVQVTIPRNSSAGDVGEILEREGVVDSAFFFEVRSRLSGNDLQAGTFTLKQGMPYGDAIAALGKPPAAPKTLNITIPEGRARRETAPLVQKAGLRGSYLAASERSSGFSPRRYGAPRKVKSLEGFLFPATYELKPDATSRQLVAKQLEAFERNIEGVSMKRARARNLSTYDVLTIASMVEREATLARERRIIAAVIYNRLKEGMPLGIDATIRYATRNWSSPLKQSELNIDSPYNTRRRTGLPPTPIGSPGLASIKAAADPAKVKYLYYVVKPNGDGAHSFSSTAEAFQRDVDAYNRERERRGGKDPSSSKGG